MTNIVVRRYGEHSSGKYLCKADGVCIDDERVTVLYCCSGILKVAMLELPSLKDCVWDYHRCFSLAFAVKLKVFLN